jgi:DNA-binding NarL/FixJ family response regulator
LTAREREVLSWLARGSTNQQIGMALHVSPRTIEKHVERILAKLGATNRTVAALLAARASNP